MEWLVEIGAKGEASQRGDTSDAVLSSLSSGLADALAGLGALAPVSGVARDRADVTFVVASDDHESAARVGIGLWEEASAKLGPGWRIVRSEVVSLDEERLRREALRPPELVGVSEVARILQVGPSRVSALQREPWFPKPLARLAAGPVWARAGIEKFDREWDRATGRRKGRGVGPDFRLEAAAQAPDVAPA